MRMRQLANTQFILFWPSHEANIRLQTFIKPGERPGEVKSKHIMDFIQDNSNKFEMESMVHWTDGALNYTKKMIGHRTYEKNPENTADNSSMEMSPLEKLYNTCVDNEFIKLKDMYGDKEEELLIRIALNKFNALIPIFQDYDELDFSDKMKKAVFQKLSAKAKHIKRFKHSLDEHQEKELEQEVEQQIQIERIKQSVAAKPKFDLRLEKLVLEGITPCGTFDELREDKILISIGTSLLNAQILDKEFCKNNENAWAEHLFVTKDFTKVAENQTISETENRSNYFCDILRPVRWIASITNPFGKDVLILLSSHECNRLKPAFRKSVKSTLFMYEARLSCRHSNLIHEPSLQLTGMTTKKRIAIEDEVQIGVYAGTMYFGNVKEQDAYCNFLGFIPKSGVEDAYANSEIEEEDGVENVPSKRRKLSNQQTSSNEANDASFKEKSGYVSLRYRRKIPFFAQQTSQCKFKDNPTDLVIKLIKTRHQVLPVHSHVASITSDGIKPLVGDITSDIKTEPINEYDGMEWNNTVTDMT